MYSLMTHSKGDETGVIVLSVVVFYFGWILTRGANYQKYKFKVDPNGTFFGKKQESINGRLLISGFWYYSRHINYFGEILQSIGLSLLVFNTEYYIKMNVFYLILPFLYPLYYFLLLFTRERDDNLRCSLKYGKLWDDYIKIVPSRIIPFIY
jgi:Delta14-sterol reductase